MPESTNRILSPPKSPSLTVLFAPAHVLIDEYQGGSEYYLPFKLMERLVLDHDVRIIALTIQLRVEHQLPGVQFVSVDPGGALPVSNLERLQFHLRVYAMAREILARGERIDVIHHMYPFGLRATFNLLSILHRPCDPPVMIGPLQSPLSFNAGDEGRVSLRDFAAVEDVTRVDRRTAPPLSSFITTPLLTLLQSWTLRRSAALVAYSERTAALYRHFSGSTSMTVIPPGVDTDEFAPPDEQNPDRAAAPEGRPIRVIAVGYLVRRKAFDVIITAIARLVGMHLPVELRIVGEGPARPALERLVRHLGVERYVSFAGLVPHRAIAREYHAADIFCSTSLSESFSIVGQEAMACGLPVVATPTGFFGEALRNHRAGTLVRFGDADGLAAAVAELVASRHLREASGRQARQLMVREFDWSVIARRYLSLYRQLASPTG